MLRSAPALLVALLLLLPSPVRAEKVPYGDFAEHQATQARLQGRLADERFWFEQQRLWLLEKEYEARAEEAATRAEQEKDTERAKALQVEAETARTMAEVHAAERRASERIRDARIRSEEEMSLLADKAMVLRQEGQPGEAAAVEAELRAKLRSVDPDTRRLNELTKRMIRARLDRNHEDGDLYQREIARIRTMLDERYGDATTAAPDTNEAHGAPVDEIRELRRTVADLQRAVADLRGPGDDDLPALVQGLVTALDDEKKLVEISIGSDDGLRVGQRLFVHDGQKYLGRIEIVRVTPDAAVCRIVQHAQGADLAKGHRVTSQL